MPDKSTIEKAKKDKAEGKSASTQSGEFVHDEIEKVKQGKHGVRNIKQAIAIGLSEARRAGFNAPAKNASKAVKKKAKQDEARAKSGKPVSKTRSKAIIKALKKEPTNTVSKKTLSQQGKAAAERRTAADRSASAKKAAKTRAENKNK